MSRLKRNGPFGRSWTIVCDVTEAETLWSLLRLVDLDAPQLFLRPPKNISMYTHDGCSFTRILCYISTNCGNGTAIRESAEYIRSKIDYPFAMFSFDLDLGTNTHLNSSFLHTPDGELYKYNGEDYELIPLKSFEISQNKQVRKLSEATLWTGRLPSEVTDEGFIYLPSTEEGITNMTKDSGGKWMIYNSGSNMTRHDEFFLAMTSLYQEGIFVGLKASTAKDCGETPPMLSNTTSLQSCRFVRKGALIFCYTADSEDKKDVLRAATAIRSVIENECVMYYKTNSASIKGTYKHEGKRYATKYMHTVSGGFYERDHLNRFKMFT
ncbi:hypothetical protein JTE90_024817 [Oedothorax gibbosus]|uniref:Uncharacterized protein n=1 Tax=Oedothorax gibbosus TaxID=931172 RepID=A0AAV6UQF2_9ARAC|nr:hypothetical protein JTE90_024817 [Oedothorax gibbosus]